MAQHDYNIANQTAPAFRTDLNNALEALATTSSGATAPATTYANMLWYDTTANILKMRNEADSAWINLLALDQGANTAQPSTLPFSSQSQAENGTNNTTVMTPLRTAQALAIRQYISPAQTITSSGSVTLTHGLGARPVRTDVYLECITGEFGYSAGDYVIANINSSSGTVTRSNSVIVTATQIIIQYSDEVSCFIVARRTAPIGQAVALTNANWRVRVNAFI